MNKKTNVKNKWAAKMKYYFTLIMMTNIKKNTQNNKSCEDKVYFLINLLLFVYNKIKPF